MALLKNENELAPNSPKNEAAWNRRYNLRKRRHSVRVLAGFHEHTHVWNIAQARGTVLQKDICDIDMHGNVVMVKRHASFSRVMQREGVLKS